MKTIKELRKEGLNILTKNNIEDAISTVDSILSTVFDMTKQELISYDDRKVIIYKEEKFFEAINNIVNNMPLSYVTGSREFMKHKYNVNENVLIPRQDTEIVVENTIERIKEMAKFNNKRIDILDMCTGSGCIAISILLYLRDNVFLNDIYDRVNVTAIDISQEAINVAKENADKNDLNDKIYFIQGDLFEKVKYKIFDIIVSNPPYIKTNVITSLDKKVQKEPIIALDGGDDGLDFYRDISNQAKIHLSRGGFLIYEIGYDQAKEVSDILKENGYTDILVNKDLSENDRVVISRK